jgi:hypothetical protein
LLKRTYKSSFEKNTKKIKPFIELIKSKKFSYLQEYYPKNNIILRLIYEKNELKNRSIEINTIIKIIL